MNLQQVEYAKSKPWFVEAGYAIPNYENYGVEVEWEVPNEFNPSMMSKRSRTFWDFDELLAWESKFFPS